MSNYAKLVENTAGSCSQATHTRLVAATLNRLAGALGCSFQFNKRARTMTSARCLYAFVTFLLTCGQLWAKGGSFHTEDRYNPQHIDGLPPEIRGAIYHMCSTPKALHPFASYLDNRRIVLHFEHFYCNENDKFCRRYGCLHQVYVLFGSQ